MQFRRHRGGGAVDFLGAQPQPVGVEVEVIAQVTSRLIVNRTALKTRPEAIGAWIARFRAALAAA